MAIRWESIPNRYLRGPACLAVFEYRKVSFPAQAQNPFPRFGPGHFPRFLYEYDSTPAHTGDEMHWTYTRNC